jgi:hypothetical protein
VQRVAFETRGESEFAARQSGVSVNRVHREHLLPAPNAGAVDLLLCQLRGFRIVSARSGNEDRKTFGRE